VDPRASNRQETTSGLIGPCGTSGLHGLCLEGVGLPPVGRPPDGQPLIPVERQCPGERREYGREHCADQPCSTVVGPRSADDSALNPYLGWSRRVSSTMWETAPRRTLPHLDRPVGPWGLASDGVLAQFAGRFHRRSNYGCCGHPVHMVVGGPVVVVPNQIEIDRWRSPDTLSGRGMPGRSTGASARCRRPAPVFHVKRRGWMSRAGRRSRCRGGGRSSGVGASQGWVGGVSSPPPVRMPESLSCCHKWPAHEE